MTPHAPLHVDAEVTSVEASGAYARVTLAASGIAERCRPGTYVSVGVGDPDLGPAAALMRRRAYWVHRTSPARGGSVTLVVAPDGRAGRWLAGRAPGDRVDLLGPLGRPFALPRQSAPCVLVGVDHDAAVLQTLAERLRERGCAVHVVLGGRTTDRLAGALEVRRAATSVQVVTADGSTGSRGDVLDVLPEVLDRTRADVVYAAAPVPTLAAVVDAAAATGALAQCAVAYPGACATVVCQGCAVPVRGDDGILRHARACSDGPVFRGERVVWADLLEATGASRG